MEQEHSVGFASPSQKIILASNLSRQLAEVEVLRSIYGGEGEFELSSEENALLESLSNLDIGEDLTVTESITFTINLLGTEMGGRHVSILISMPHGYPEVEPVNVNVKCGGAVLRAEHETINSEARKLAKQLSGQESVLEIVQKIQELALCVTSSKKKCFNGDDQPISQVCTRTCIKRVLIWFHHIKSLQKRKSVVEWGRSYNLGGYSKPGFPGIIIIEGEKEGVDTYVRQLQSLRWQAMSIRGDEEEEIPYENELDSKRHFTTGIKELDEHGMSELARLCREANLEQLFLTALKINR